MMKTTRLDQWRQLPTKWIQNQELKWLRWSTHGGDAIVCLMLVLLLAQRRGLLSNGANELNVHATYDDIELALGRSRTTISKGVKLLLQMGWIAKLPERSGYTFTSDPIPWGKVPVKALYDASGFMQPFSGWTLRNSLELDALKLYFVLVAFRNSSSNDTRISYNKLNFYSGVAMGRIKGALNFLVASHLIYIEKEEAWVLGENDPANVYRLRGVDPYRHEGTATRQVEDALF